MQQPPTTPSSVKLLRSDCEATTFNSQSPLHAPLWLLDRIIKLAWKLHNLAIMLGTHVTVTRQTLLELFLAKQVYTTHDSQSVILRCSPRTFVSADPNFTSLRRLEESRRVRAHRAFLDLYAAASARSFLASARSDGQKPSVKRYTSQRRKLKARKATMQD